MFVHFLVVVFDNPEEVRCEQLDVRKSQRVIRASQDCVEEFIRKGLFSIPSHNILVMLIFLEDKGVTFFKIAYVLFIFGRGEKFLCQLHKPAKS